MVRLTLPTDSAERKNIPIVSGCLDYAPAALAGMARWSKLGNDKHNPGQPLHHARGKSMDHADTIVRHLMDIRDAQVAIERGDYPATEHEALLRQLKDDLDALVWRAALLSQEAHEKYFGAPLAPGARLPLTTTGNAEAEKAARGMLDGVAAALEPPKCYCNGELYGHPTTFEHSVDGVCL